MPPITNHSYTVHYIVYFIMNDILLLDVQSLVQVFTIYAVIMHGLWLCVFSNNIVHKRRTGPVVFDYWVHLN